MIVDWDTSWQNPTEKQHAVLDFILDRRMVEDEQEREEILRTSLENHTNILWSMLVTDMSDLTLTHLGSMLLVTKDSAWHEIAKKWAKGDMDEFEVVPGFYEIYKPLGVFLDKLFESEIIDGKWWNLEKIEPDPDRLAMHLYHLKCISAMMPGLPRAFFIIDSILTPMADLQKLSRILTGYENTETARHLIALGYIRQSYDLEFREHVWNHLLYTLDLVLDILDRLDKEENDE